MALDGSPPAGFGPFSDDTANGTCYLIIDATGANWEVGYGYYLTGPGELVRTQVTMNSSVTTSKISFSSGTKTIMIVEHAHVQMQKMAALPISIGNNWAMP
jgi:hypothetical protein